MTPCQTVCLSRYVSVQKLFALAFLISCKIVVGCGATAVGKCGAMGGAMAAKITPTGFFEPKKAQYSHLGLEPENKAPKARRGTTRLRRAAPRSL